MKNADKPAYPTRNANGVPFSLDDGHEENLMTLAVGFTKREAFAMAAMQGILSNQALMNHGQFDLPNAIARSINAADELLKQLES